MKKILTILLLFVSYTVTAQDAQLPAPDKNRGLKLMQALSERKSIREFNDKILGEQDMSDLLWAAIGKNRDDGKLTAPTAVNRQEIRLFVFTAESVSEYIPSTHSLHCIVNGDYRALVAGRQEFAKTAPVSLVIVGDMDKFGKDDEHARMMVCVDAGIVCQNINLFCAAVGLATVPRATMEHEAIQKLLGFNSKQIPIMNNPVGYIK